MLLFFLIKQAAIAYSLAKLVKQNKKNDTYALFIYLRGRDF